jgi:acetyl-CoA carboxylase carboxyl transferase subunit beta
MSEPAPNSPLACPECGASQPASGRFARYRVCDECGHHAPLSARQRLSQLVDPGTFVESAETLVSVDPLDFSDRIPYRERLAQARERTGLTDAVITGVGRINGDQAVLAIMDFEFMGGSMGSVVGEKIARAMELAIARKLPFVAVTSSGGARMQEGMLSLVQMAKTAAAAMRLHRAGVPFISVLTDPTTGGVFASFASQGDIVLAEPGALIGFAGPRVIEQTTGKPPPQGSHTAEFLLQHGLVDAIVPRPRLRGVLALLLSLFGPTVPAAVPDDQPYRPTRRPAEPAWREVELARHPRRPTSLDYLRRLMPQWLELHGDRVSGDDAALIGGVGELGGVTVVVIAQERGREGGRVRPEGFRKAARLMRLAAQWKLPLVTLIDTPGAAVDFEAEAHGLAQSISACLANLSVLPVPVVAAVIGEGGSGGALALGVADRVLMLENAIYSVIAPEGAAAIIYRSAERARDIADALKLTAHDCKLLGVVDTLVAEPEGGAHNDPDYAALLLRAALVQALAELRKTPGPTLAEERYRKFRRMGEVDVAARESRARELAALQGRVGRALGSLVDRWTRGRDGQAPEAGPATASGRPPATAAE